jgi:hypothetical protein
VTANSLSSIINGVATILLFVFIDPYLSVLTDDVMEGKETDSFFRRCITLFVLSRLVGTILAQFMLLPAAKLISVIAEHM